MSIVVKCSVFRLDGKALDAFLYISDYLCVDIERTGDFDNLLRIFGREVYFHTVTHVEYLVHLFPIGSAFVVDCTEERWYGEHVVFDHTAVVADEMQHLGLCASCAVYHTVDIGTHLVEHLPDYGSIGAGGREDKLTGIHRGAFHCLVEAIGTAIYQLVWYGMVVSLGIFLCNVFREHVVTCRGESVAAHTSVVSCFIGSLPA